MMTAVVPLPPARRFYFRGQDPSDPAAAAATLEEFHRLLGSADTAAVGYHATRGDFSRWIAEVLADQALARDVAHVERDLEARRSAAVEDARQQIRRAQPSTIDLRPRLRMALNTMPMTK